MVEKKIKKCLHFILKCVIIIMQDGKQNTSWFLLTKGREEARLPPVG